MNVIPSILSSAGFAVLYGLTVGHHGGQGLAAGAVAGVAFLAAFLLPVRLFTYSTGDVAPVVLSQLANRWMVATALTLAAGLAAYWLAPQAKALQLGMELYMYSAVAIVIFHGLAGMYANHIVYLQVTRQYNSNQLLAVTMLLTVLLVVVTLYCLSFDLAAARESYFYVRDLLVVTLAMVGYGWHGFRIAHH